MIIETFHIVWGNRQTDSHFLIILVQLFLRILPHCMLSEMLVNILSFSFAQSAVCWRKRWWKCIEKHVRIEAWEREREREGKFWERKFMKHKWKWNKSRIVTIAPFLWDNDYKSSYYLIMWLYSHSDFVACHLSWKKIYSISSENNGSTTIACD